MSTTNRMWRKNGPILSTEGKRGYFDLSYGEDSKAQELDIWLPEGEGPFPLILSIHGGGFVACDKRQSDMIIPMLEALNRGYAVAGINYRLIDEDIFPKPVQDIKQAIRYLRANAKKYNLDSNKFITWGGSAGGYFTLMSATFEDIELFDNVNDSNLSTSAKVNGCVAWYPVSDFTKLDEQLEVNSILNKFLQKDKLDDNEEYMDAFPISKSDDFPFHNDKNSVGWIFAGSDIGCINDDIKKVNPISYINKDMPPILLQHGSGDEILPMQQSVEYALKVNKLCNEERATVEIIPNAIHGSLLFETEANISRVLDFIDGVLENER